MTDSNDAPYITPVIPLELYDYQHKIVDELLEGIKRDNPIRLYISTPAGAVNPFYEMWLNRAPKKGAL